MIFDKKHIEGWDLIATFAKGNIRMYGKSNDELGLHEVKVYELEGYSIDDERSPWNGAKTTVQIMLRAHRMFDGFRHVYFMGCETLEDDAESCCGYFNYQRMDIMAEICAKLHELGPIT